MTISGRAARDAPRRAPRRSRTSPSMLAHALADAAPARTATARSARPARSPSRSAPSDCSHSASHAPLKPVWPVSSTRRSAPERRVDAAASLAGGACALTRPSSSPPRRLAAGPQLLEVVAVAQRVHRLPEAVVAVGRELAVAASARSGSCSQTVSSPSM